jgi:predicted LPLAT superfamily acyltransferase/glycosyltransferase involved in cell wall biosynthesis
MSFAPCLLIPIYNHGDSIRGTVERLAPHGLPIMVVDDGSDAATQQVLAQLAADVALVRLRRLEQNGGKGAAVMHGMQQARAAGFTHALQIDADGQHDAADVPRFLELGRAHPHAVISGRPLYDASAPGSRRYGRYFSHAWVWLETLSFSIGDSMCGFRLYPLAPACALIGEGRLPPRMDFDTAVAVRLAWRGVRFINLDTRVTYPADGVSHFDLLKDNLRITRTHTRLFFGMLPRLPLLLWRKLRPVPDADGAHWSKLAERGSMAGLRIVAACYRILGERVARALLYPVVAYFLLAHGKARRASLDYLQRVRARGATHVDAGWRGSFRHLLAFAQSGLDKLAGWHGHFDGGRVAFPDRAAFDALLASGRGAVLIGAHLGNLEMTRALALRERAAVINAIVYTDHAVRFNAALAEASADFHTRLIQVSGVGPDTAILLREKVDRGELVVIVGDRTPPAEGGAGRSVSPVDFLGAPAPFAHGPFILASLLECPVYLFFCLREDAGYRIYCEPFADRIELPRRERLPRLRGYLQQYADRLEAYCVKAPYQWFNFYDFWQRDALDG